VEKSLNEMSQQAGKLSYGNARLRAEVAQLEAQIQTLLSELSVLREAQANYTKVPANRCFIMQPS